MVSKIAYSIAEAVEHTGICRSRLYEEIAVGRLKVRKCGRRTIIGSDDLWEWFKSLPVAGASKARTG